MIEKLRSGEWHLITTENSASVLEFCEIDGRKIGNVLVVGGRKNGSLRELMDVYEAVCHSLRSLGFSYLCGQPRKEWHRFLIAKHGFKKQNNELIKELI
jgi:hypothetical protein